MDSVNESFSEYDAIAKRVQFYIDGAKSSRGGDMPSAFHPDATIFGFSDGEIFAGPIQKLFDSASNETPASALQARLVSIDIVDTIAAVRVELESWNGYVAEVGLLRRDIAKCLSRA
jgi:hypothetical protein